MHIKPFDLVDTPLSGINLIESGAGTGKTYAITGLFLRLILEKGLAVDQILVVTFTKAATEELKDRIRQTLLRVRSGLSTGAFPDPLLEEMLDRQPDKADAHRRIRDALTDFDTAAIYTIHGFCQRILFENAFETGCLFDTEIATETTRIYQKVAEDFWRQHTYDIPPEVIAYAIDAAGLSDPACFLTMLERYGRSDISVVPVVDRPTFTHLEPYRRIMARVRTQWPSARDACTCLLNDPGLNASVYGSKKNGIREMKNTALKHSMDRFIDPVGVGFPPFKGFEKLTRRKLEQSVKKGHLPPEHPFFDLCTELCVAGAALQSEVERYLLYLKTRLFQFAAVELRKRKREENVNFFHDLLVTVNQALERAGSGGLRQTIGNRYKAALVDEFQDTDLLQYNIFSKLFTGKDAILFLIGDPKQAIYAFRGADVFSYLKAVRNTEKRYTLTTNWRSSPDLITAVNTIFLNNRLPFLFPDIRFDKAVPGKPGPERDKKRPPPLVLWYLDLKTEKPVAKTEATHLIAEQVAGEIQHLICDRADRVNTGDIAVLVRTNRQAQIVKSYLAARAIPAVLYQSGNIFDSREAAEIERILSSISEPRNERRFRAAMATEIMGIPGEAFDMAGSGGAALDSRRENFRRYLDLWDAGGFIRMFRFFLAREKIREHILSFPDGERRITNILQIEELLQTVSAERRLGTSGLVKWLSEQRNPKTPRMEAHQLRLESDAHAVRIATIHKSKGLEYDTVFCPFSWEASDITDRIIVYHDPENREQICLDLGSGEIDSHRKIAQDEQLSENLRLLYVALTRARLKCYLAWGRIRNAETSAPAYLFHYDGAPTVSAIVPDLKQRVRGKGSDQLLSDIHRVVEASNGSISLVSLPVRRSTTISRMPSEDVRLFKRRFSADIDASWRISSYSSLVHQTGTREAATREASPDRDAGSHLDAAADGILSAAGIGAFPRGVRAGLFFHELLENIRFSDPVDVIKGVVKTKLNTYAFDPDWEGVVLEMIRQVASVPLPAVDAPFSLMETHPEHRITEMEFYFPLNMVPPRRLRNIFAAFGGVHLPAEFPNRLGGLSYAPAAGFMKGFVDLIFEHRGKYYIVDWKSNFLGPDIEHYRQEALRNAMVEGYYILQYHLYVLAVDRYLSARIPGYRYETHFGGVFYLFLRGIDSRRGPSFGIYSDLPDEKIVEALRSALIPESVP